MATEMGTAQFCDYEGVPESRALGGELLVLGHALQAPWGEPKDGHYVIGLPSRHFLSVAPTRSGKGVSLIIPNLLQYAGSAIVIDPKGENAWITAKYRREKLGQKTFILDPWGEVNRRYGDLAGEQETIARFNPVSILDPASEHYADDVGYLADALIINQGKEPHWDNSARELVGGLIAFVVENPDLRPVATLGLVRKMLAQAPDVLRKTAEEAQALGGDSVAARKLGRFVIESSEIASIVSTALTQTAFLDGNALNASMAASDFSFDDLVNGKATIYLVLPVDKLQTHGRWLRLMVSIGIRTIARNVKPLPLPVLFLLDEFGTIGRLSAVAQAYGLMAGLQMVIWAFVQDLVQLKRDYPEDWETFISNSQSVTFFNVMDQFTAKYFSEMLGSKTVEVISEATRKERAKNPNYSSMDDKIYGRDLLQASEIRTLLLHLNGVVLTRHDPVMFRKMTYHKEKVFALRARPDPHFENKWLAMDALADRITNAETAMNELKKIGVKVTKKSALLGSDKFEVLVPGDAKPVILASEAELVKWIKETLRK